MYNGLIFNSNLRKMRPIYIADDSADQCYLLSYFLRRINPEYQISVFDRAQMLIESLSFLIDSDGILPSVVFLDLQMPEMDGFEVLKTIRQSSTQNSGWSKVRIVIYSSHSDQDIIQRCMNAGAFAVIQKPANQGELTSLLVSVST